MISTNISASHSSANPVKVGPTRTIDDEPLRMRTRQLALPGDVLAMHGVVVTSRALACRRERPSIVEHGDVQPRFESRIVCKRRHERKVIPGQRSRCGQRGVPVAASSLEPSREARSQRAPVEDSGSELGLPCTHPARKFLGRVETAIFVTENEMVCPRDANYIHGVIRFTQW